MKPGVEKTGSVRAGLGVAVVSSACFHSNWNPAFDRLCLEILGSVRTEDVRCASLRLVGQTPPPRPRACPIPAAPRIKTTHQTGRQAKRLITRTPSKGAANGSPLLLLTNDL